ncbi:Hypothetical protein A7982_00534 [Minicystis rosea]|nr:Hypothetical protein A7982_00534 [Minicystis rosea]
MLAAAAMVLGGCSVIEPASYPEAPPWQIEDEPIDRVSSFALRTDRGTALVLRVGAAEIMGPDVNLGRFIEAEGVAIRGRAFGRPVSLDVGAEGVTGLFDSRPVSLAVESHDGALHFNGLVGGEMSSFAIGPRFAEGMIGRCSYELSRTDLGYEGRRSCGGATARVWLRIPTALERWGDQERAAVLAILLSR